MPKKTKPDVPMVKVRFTGTIECCVEMEVPENSTEADLAKLEMKIRNKSSHWEFSGGTWTERDEETNTLYLVSFSSGKKQRLGKVHGS